MGVLTVMARKLPWLLILSAILLLSSGTSAQVKESSVLIFGVSAVVPKGCQQMPLRQSNQQLDLVWCYQVNWDLKYLAIKGILHLQWLCVLLPAGELDLCQGKILVHLDACNSSSLQNHIADQTVDQCIPLDGVHLVRPYIPLA
eukprot:Gb_22455 [translate_table: standard]